MSGDDTIVIKGRNFSDLADGNCVELTFPNDIANVKTGKNGNSIYGLNTSGRQAELKLRLIRGSQDDIYMNGLLNNQQNNFQGFVLLSGSFTKNIGNGEAGVLPDTYNVAGGVFVKQVEGKTNVEGDIEQSISVYTIRFSNAPRAIG